MLDAGELPLGFLIESAMVYLPALWVMIGLAIALNGLFPHRSGLIWAYYVNAHLKGFSIAQGQ